MGEAALTAPKPAGTSGLGFWIVGPACGLALLTLCVGFWLFDRSLYFGFMSVWGVPALSEPFFDWADVVGPMHCAARGVNVYADSHCGVFVYSPLWAWARLVPEGGGWRIATGLAIDVAFFASLALVHRPRSWGESALFALACVSPPVAYAAERANVDILMFLMMLPAIGWANRGLFQRAITYLIIGFAGLLKFYPMAGLAIALRETTGRFVAAALLALAGLAAVLLAMRGDLAAVVANIPGGGRYGVDAFGAPNLIYLLLGPAPPPIEWDLSLAALGLVCLAVALRAARSPALGRAIDCLAERDRIVLVIGAAIVVGCFFAGQNIDYRAMFLILVIAGLLSLRGAADDGATRKHLAWLIAGALVLMWLCRARADFYVQGTAVPGVLPLLGALIWLRELIWWWVIASLLSLLVIFAAQSRALAPLLEGFGIGAAESRR